VPGTAAGPPRLEEVGPRRVPGQHGRVLEGRVVLQVLLLQDRHGPGEGLQGGQRAGDAGEAGGIEGAPSGLVEQAVQPGDQALLPIGGRRPVGPQGEPGDVLQVPQADQQLREAAPVVGPLRVGAQPHGPGQADPLHAQAEEGLRGLVGAVLRRGDPRRGEHPLAQGGEVAPLQLGQIPKGHRVDRPVQGGGHVAPAAPGDHGPAPALEEPAPAPDLLQEAQLPLLADLHRLVQVGAPGGEGDAGLLQRLRQHRREGVPLLLASLDENVLAARAGPLLPEDRVPGEAPGRLPPLLLGEPLPQDAEADLGTEGQQLRPGPQVPLPLRHRLGAAEEQDRVEGLLDVGNDLPVGPGPGRHAHRGQDDPLRVCLLQGLQEEEGKDRVGAGDLQDPRVLRDQRQDQRVDGADVDVPGGDAADRSQGQGAGGPSASRPDGPVQGAPIPQAGQAGLAHLPGKQAPEDVEPPLDHLPGVARDLRHGFQDPPPEGA